MRHRLLLFGDTAGGFAGSGVSLRNKFSAYYDLDDLSTLNDKVGSNNLTNNNTVTFTGGGTPAGYAGFAAASSQSLTRADTAAIKLNGVDFSIIGWLNPVSTAGSTRVFCKGSVANSTLEYRMTKSSGSLLFGMYNGASFQQVSFGSLASNTWGFYSITRTNATGVVSCRFNAGAESTFTLTGDISGTNMLALGRDGAFDSGHFDGKMTRFGIVKGYVLSLAEIQHLYNAGAGRLYSEITI